MLKTMVKLKLIREILQQTIDNIDAGNTKLSEESCNIILENLIHINEGVERYSKQRVCDEILHCSPSTFDKYLALGLIPKGRKELGFKELSWRKADFNDAIMYRIGKYKSKNGL